MKIYGTLVVLHLLGACVWVGWHMALTFSLLPQAVNLRDGDLWRRIENVYRVVGIPALVLQSLSGLTLAFLHLPDLRLWFDFESPMGRLVAIKVFLLLVTLALGFDFRFRLLPKIEVVGPACAKTHIALITFVSVLLVFVGASFRIGWLY